MPWNGISKEEGDPKELFDEDKRDLDFCSGFRILLRSFNYSFMFQ
jgi:hypothetical protein